MVDLHLIADNQTATVPPQLCELRKTLQVWLSKAHLFKTQGSKEVGHCTYEDLEGSGPSKVL